MCDAVVVKISNLAQAHHVVLAKGHAAVAVKQIGMIGIHEFLDFIIPLLVPARIVGIPALVTRIGGEMIKIPVVGIGTVIRHAGQRPGLVGLVRVLKPSEARAQMFGHAEGQTIFLRRLLPFAHHVAVRAVVHGIPRVQRRVPQEKIVVMRAHADEIFRAGLFVERHQLFRIPILCLPQRDDVLPTVGGRMAPAFEMVFVIF